MLNKNFTKQEGIKDCGPCCLQMIIKHYKGYVDIDTLKEMCKTSIKGTDAYHLIEAIKKCGFEASGVRCDLEDIKNIILPCIAHVTINNSYNHFVVIDKIDYKNKKILIKDPASKIKYYTFDDFEKIFNKIIIHLYPIKKIKYTPKNSIIKFLKEITLTSTTELKEIIIISIFITIASIIQTFYMKYMLDNVTGKKDKIIFIFVIFLIVYLFKIILNYLRRKLIVLINQKISLSLNKKIFKQIINLPYFYYRNNTTGEIVSKINDLDTLNQVISNSLITLFIDFPLVIIALIIMYFISKTLFFISFIMFILYLLVILIFRSFLNNKIDECINDKASVTSFMVESINGYETIKGINIENKILNKFENKYTKLLNNNYDLDNCYNLQFLLNEFINDIGFLIIILVGVFLVIDNKLTIGELISFNSLLTYFLEPIRNILNLDNNIRHFKISIKKIINLFYKETNNYVIDNKMKGDIIIKNLTYSYDEVNILNNISLKIKSGEKIMMIGKSGSGKSTLAKILKKYISIPRDKVFINNIDINDYKNSDILYVSQNELLFTDSVLENIGNDNVFDVAKICLVDEIINKNPLGYNMIIEENGFNLSGGERQRIILSRAINRDFNILIIDEGMNQVDVKMEKQILMHIFNKFKDKTIIYISHRENNHNLFDKTIKLEKGVINEQRYI